MLRRTAIIFFILMFIASGYNAKAWTEKQDYIRNPGNIPRFANYTTPSIDAGNSGYLYFSITNRYNGSLDQARLTVQIYSFGTIDYEKNISETRNPPQISNETNKQSATINFNRLGSGATIRKGIFIKTSSDTEQGTYSVRFNLTFILQTDKYTMLSIGYFSKEDWKWATNNPGNDDSGINMTFLYNKYGAIAIIPDTSFSVKSQVIMPPLSWWQPDVIAYGIIGVTLAGGIGLVIFVVVWTRKKPVPPQCPPSPPR